MRPTRTRDTAAVRVDRWGPVVAYAAVGAANQMLWLTFTPFTTDAARHWDVSSDAVGWLAELFPLVYVVLALPAGRLIDRSMPVWLAWGAALTAAGGVVRLAGSGYAAALVGAVLVAVAQPLVLNAVTAVSASYLSPGRRSAGIAVSSAGVFGGMLVALLSGAALGTAHLSTLLVLQAVFAVVPAVALVTMLGRRSTAVASDGVLPEGVAPVLDAPVRRVWADPAIRRLVGLVCVGFGVFVAVTTWLQALLEPAGVSDGAAGYLLVTMVAAGVVGSAVVPGPVIGRGAETTFLAWSVIGGAAAMVLLAVAPGTWTGLVASVALGALLLTDLPIVLDLVQRRAGDAEGTASALVWLAGNAAGLVVALIVQVLRHHPATAFTVLAVVPLMTLPLLPGLRRAMSAQAGGRVGR